MDRFFFFHICNQNLEDLQFGSISHVTKCNYPVCSTGLLPIQFCEVRPNNKYLIKIKRKGLSLIPVTFPPFLSSFCVNRAEILEEKMSIRPSPSQFGNTEFRSSLALSIKRDNWNLKTYLSSLKLSDFF